MVLKLKQMRILVELNILPKLQLALGVSWALFIIYNPAEGCSIDEERLRSCSQLNKAIQVLDNGPEVLLHISFGSDTIKLCLEECSDIRVVIRREFLVQ